jgi:hypothetical protein
MMPYCRQPIGKTLGVTLVVLAALALTDAMGKPVRSFKVEKGEPVAIAGVCQNEDGTPLAGVRVALYHDDILEKAKLLRTVITGDDGRFEFRDLPATDGRHSGYGVVATKAGRGSYLQFLYDNSEKAPLNIQLRPAATLQGRVTNTKGEPVANALVWASALRFGPVEGICSARTDAQGSYRIADLGAWERNGPGAGGRFFDVLHPNYGHKRPLHRKVPDTIDVVLEPGSTIEGTVIDQVTRKPAARAWVAMQTTNNPPFVGGWCEALTDASGKYRFTSLVAAKYNIFAEASDRACEAIDSFEVESGKSYTVPDLTLVTGGWIEGWLVEAATGQPFSGKVKEGRLSIGCYGPARPKSGAAVQASPVDDKGHFEMRVPPGVNFPYLMNRNYLPGQGGFPNGIQVNSGEVANIEFRVIPPGSRP